MKTLGIKHNLLQARFSCGLGLANSCFLGHLFSGGLSAPAPSITTAEKKKEQLADWAAK